MNLMFWRRRNNETHNDGPMSGEDRVMEQLSAYLDGELDETETAEVEALIARDPSAAEVLGDLRLVRSAFGALGEVRAPRSFAIPAEAAAAPRSVGSPLALFRRTELFMRASAAVAALFFVVALVNSPSAETPTANFASDGAQTSMSAPAQESLQATEEGAAGTLAAPEPATAEGGSTDDSDSSGGGDAGTMGALAAPSPEAANTGEASEGGAGGGLREDAPTSDMQGDAPPAEPATAGDSSRSAEELRPLPTGTELAEDSSQGVGGMVLGLGVVAGLLTALSVLTAWNRRSGDSTR